MEELAKTLGDKGLTISTHPQKGRCLLTARDFSPGEVILSQEPYVSVPNKNSSDPSRKCDWCFSSRGLKKCSVCHFVWYCGSNCQKSDWKLHRLECQLLSKVEKERINSLTPSIRLMVQLCLRKKLENEKVMPVTATDNSNLIEALVSHMSEIGEEQLVLYAQMANLVNMILQPSDTKTSIKEITVNFSKLACNAHTICDAELRPLGTGLYLIISLINHSCLPNSVLLFDGRLAIVRATQFLPKGTEVTISYIETAGSTMSRLKALKEQYFFSCTCPRCINMGLSDDIEESAILEGYRCKNTRCNSYLLRDSDDKGFVCQNCGLLREKEEIANLTSEVKSLSEKASKLHSSGHYRDACALYKVVENLQIQFCHPFSINLLRNRETLLKIFMESQCWTEALEYARLILSVYQRIYPAVHPLLGLQYYTCGKLEWFLGETYPAMRSLSKAVDIMRITHGTSIPFMKDLLALLEEARAEASYKQSSGEEERL